MAQSRFVLIALVSGFTSLTLQGCLFGGPDKAKKEDSAHHSTPSPTYPPGPCDEPTNGTCIFDEANKDKSTGWAPNSTCEDGRDFCANYNSCGQCEMFHPCCMWRPDSDLPPRAAADQAPPVLKGEKDAEKDTEKDNDDGKKEDAEKDAEKDVEKDLTDGVRLCEEGHEHECPSEWKEGGFHCNDHGGCRHVKDGKFPKNACKEQCFMVPDTKEKARKSEPAFMHNVPVCHAGHEHACPTEWKDGGFHCNGHGGCREAKEGPFPKADCEDQCFIAPHTKEGAKELVEDIVA